MKRWILLWTVCLLMLVPQPLQAAVIEPTPHPDHPVVLHVFSQRRILIIEGRGREVFSHTFGDERYQYVPKRVLTTSEGFVVVGERISRLEEQYYEIFLLRINLHGDVIEHSIFEESRNDALRDVFVYDQTTMIHTQAQHIPAGAQDLEWVADKVYWIAFGEVLETYVFSESFSKAKQFGQTMALYLDDPLVPEVLILDEHQLLRAGQMRGVEPRGVYVGEVTLQFVGPLRLNGRLIHTPITLDEPGVYEVGFAGATFQFTLHPSLQGVSSQGLYKEALRIHYSAGQAWLNDDLYYSGALIDQPGHHRLIFTAPTYRYEVPFTLTANVQGVLDRQVYDSPRTLTFQGEGYLNNTFITSPHTVSESGQYVLRVYGQAGYEETHSFNLQLEPQRSLDYWHMGEILLLSTSILCGLYFSISHLLKKRQKSR